MNAERATLLGALLREMREQDGGFFPEEAWLEIHQTFAIPYVELVIPRRPPGGEWECFLMRRPADDPNWPGRPWHIPGGIWRAHETLEQACNTVGGRELHARFADVVEVMSYKWPDHVYSRCISHVCLCRPVREPLESDAARFFPFNALPVPLLKHQDTFLARVRTHLDSRPHD